LIDFQKPTNYPPWLKKINTHTPSQRGLPIQEVSPRRRTESPTRRSPRRTNSPQAGNEGGFGNINVSPNDQSLDSQANHDVASDSVVPGFVADHFENDNEDVTVQLAQPDFDSLDPYSVLGVPQQATNHQIKMTYHKLSKQYHPDQLTSLPNQQDAQTIFTLISNEYEFLMDPDKRRKYDLLLRSIHTVIKNANYNVNDEDSGNEEEKVFGKCDWVHVIACNFPQLKPLKCTVEGCIKLVHHLCQIEFERREGFPEIMPLKCCLHHPQSLSYQVMGTWIYIAGFHRRVKVPSVRSILYSTT
jgi:hypothetical protein